MLKIDFSMPYKSLSFQSFFNHIISQYDIRLTAFRFKGCKVYKIVCFLIDMIDELIIFMQNDNG